MVAGPVGRLLWALAARMFDGCTSERDGAVAVTTREAPTVVAGRLAGPGGVDRERLAVVDCRGVGDADADVGRYRRVDPRARPGTLEAAVADCLADLEAAGVDRTHFLFDTLASGYRLPAPSVTKDRAHELAMTVGTRDGVGLFTADTTRLPGDVVDELGHLFDVRVDLRRPTRTTELRWKGLLGASDGWLPLAEADLRGGEFR